MNSLYLWKKNHKKWESVKRESKKVLTAISSERSAELVEPLIHFKGKTDINKKI